MTYPYFVYFLKIFPMESFPSSFTMRELRTWVFRLKEPTQKVARKPKKTRPTGRHVITKLIGVKEKILTIPRDRDWGVGLVEFTSKEWKLIQKDIRFSSNIGFWKINAVTPEESHFQPRISYLAKVSVKCEWRKSIFRNTKG